MKAVSQSNINVFCVTFSYRNSEIPESVMVYLIVTVLTFGRCIPVALVVPLGWGTIVLSVSERQELLDV